MTIHSRATRPIAFLFPLIIGVQPVLATAVQAEEAATQQVVKVLPNSPLGQVVPPAVSVLPAPTTLNAGDPWLYRGSDIPHDAEWLFGELSNGLRYAVRNNRVPGQQVSIRIRIDAGSLNERDSEQGYAHLMEHLTFRESKYLANGQAIPTWQRLGARLGADTNAITSPTQTVYQLDLPGASPAKLDESLKLLSGMIQEPALTDANVAAEVPIVLAEIAENGGAAKRIADASSELFYKGQPLAFRSPGGTVETLKASTSQSLRAFHTRWYRPQNTVIAIAGDGSPQDFAALIERYFSDWTVAGMPVPAPDFGKPMAPEGVDPANPVGETKVLVEPALPRTVAYVVLRPWSKPVDNIEFNRKRMLGQVAEAIINRRLLERARAGGNYVQADVSRSEEARSVDATFVNVIPIGADWKAALREVRGVIADALEEPPTEDEIARVLSEMDVAITDMYEQQVNQPGARLADDLVGALDIHETVASPETFVMVFRGMRDRFTPQAILENARELFQGTVIRGRLITPQIGEATEEDLRQELLTPVEADSASRVTASDISFESLPRIGAPGVVVNRGMIGIGDIEQVDFANGVKALLKRSENEPGRVTVRVRFGSGYRAFSQEEAPYISLGKMALVESGLGPLGANELEGVVAGRKLGFGFGIEDGVFTLRAQTRKEDLANQLYLFAGKLALPRWDAPTVDRAKALAALGYDSLNTDPASVLRRDLDWLINDRDARFATPTPQEMASTTAEGFRKVWEPLLKQGPIEVMVFGDIDRAATIDALSETFGALAPREPIPAQALARTLKFPAHQSEAVILHHGGDASQAAAAVAWPLGGGAEGVATSRQLDVVSELFSNRLLEAMREQAGASYTPFVNSSWPMDVEEGGRMLAIGQMAPEAIPQFFEVVDKIAHDLATEGPTEDELVRVTEPFKQQLARLIDGYTFWLDLVEGSTTDPARLERLDSLPADFTELTADQVKALAAKYLVSGKSMRIAVLPDGQELAQSAAVRPVRASPADAVVPIGR